MRTDQLICFIYNHSFVHISRTIISLTQFENGAYDRMSFFIGFMLSMISAIIVTNIMATGRDFKK